jgi:hypothetical protein
MTAVFPVTAVRIDGNQLTYTSNGEFSGVMLMNSQLNVGAGPPTIRILQGTHTTSVPIAVGGGQPYFLFFQGRRLCADFIAAGPGMVPPPPPPGMSNPVAPPFQQPGSAQAPNPMMPPPAGILLGEEAGMNEIEIMGERALGPDADGRIWCFASKQEGARLILPHLHRKGQNLTIVNWASMTGFGPEDAKAIHLHVRQQDGAVTPFFPLGPGESRRFVSIRGRNGALRWVPL